jgi:hypothetical protein
MRVRAVVGILVGAVINAALIANTALAFRDIDKDIKNVTPAEPARPPPEEIITKEIVNYRADDLRDPFEGYKEQKVAGDQPATAESALPSLAVKGVVWGSDTPQAIINNQVVKVGEIISGVKVVSIEREGIKVLYQGRPYELITPAVALLKSMEQEPGGKNEKK